MSLYGWSRFNPSVFTIRFEGGPHNGMRKGWIAKHKVTVGTRNNKYKIPTPIVHENTEYELIDKRGREYIYRFVRNIPIKMSGDPYGGDPHDYYGGHCH